MADVEHWRWVDGYEGLYMVSDQGRVMSVPRGTGRSFFSGRVLKQGFGNSGYLHVALCRDGKMKTKEVHRMVATAFIKRPRNKTEVNHKDGIKTNNVVSNLEWVTRSENIKHSYANLPRKQYDHFHKVKLTDEKVAEIMNRSGTNAEIASIYGISDVMVGRIKNKKAWRHITCQSTECV